MFSIITGNCQDICKQFPENTFHACISDPPYGLGIAGESWDHSVPTTDIWREVYRTLRPGAFLLSFCSPELYHRMAVNVEDAGFIIKDQIMWMTTTKMPKHNRLKPAHEPIVVAQKPYKGSLQSNFEQWGCGIIDVENTRVPWDKEPPKGWVAGGAKRRTFGKEGNNHPTVKPVSLMEYLVKIYSPIGGQVLDPFCGSGTTGVGCINNDREFVGIDLSEDYTQIAKERCDIVSNLQMSAIV